MAEDPGQGPNQAVAAQRADGLAALARGDTLGTGVIRARGLHHVEVRTHSLELGPDPGQRGARPARARRRVDDHREPPSHGA